MLRLFEIKLALSDLPPEPLRSSLDDADINADKTPMPEPTAKLLSEAATILKIEPSCIAVLTVFKRSFDARKRDEVLAIFIVDVTLVDASIEEDLLKQHCANSHISRTPDMRYVPPFEVSAVLADSVNAPAKRPVVVGFGPCGMFAALLLAQMKMRPIVIERGPSVRERTQQTWDLWRKEILHPEGNVQFGEGGAGTFSDGKLYSQIKDPRYLGRKVLEELVEHGAPIDILTQAHPHIGTFKLVKIVQSMRERIKELGGEVRFNQKVVEIQMDSTHQGKQVRALVIESTQNNKDSPEGRYELACDNVVFAMGHSARDTFSMLLESGLAIEVKSFSIGFRIEHAQSIINEARWGKQAANPLLGAADYKLVHHASNGRTVYSFCMCPGGTVVAATSEEKRVVTNGMSQYSRAERNANSGLVVGIDPSDYPIDEPSFIHAYGEEKGKQFAAQAANMALNNMVHPLAGVVLQRLLESTAYDMGGGNYVAPAQLLGDFLENRSSTALGTIEPSYRPGVRLTNLNSSLPSFVIEAIHEAIPIFGRKIRGYDHDDAVLTGLETRTSSPIKLPRGADFQSVNVQGFYPAGEGAGYAGGILSAAVDGIKVAEQVIQRMLRAV